MKFWLIPFGVAQNVPHFGTVWQMCNYKFVGIWYPIFAPSRCEDANPLQVAIESMVSLFQDFESLSEQQLSAEFCDYLKWGNQRNTHLKTMKVYTLSKSGCQEFWPSNLVFLYMLSEAPVYSLVPCGRCWMPSYWWDIIFQVRAVPLKHVWIMDLMPTC